MQTVLLVVHLMVVIALIGVVLLQRSEGGALGIGGGGGFMTSRGTANVLTRTTAILAAIFFLTSIALTILPRFLGGPGSILDTVPGAAPAAPADAPVGTGGGGVLDDLKRLQQPQGEAPAAPAAPTGEAPASAPGAPAAPAGETPPAANGATLDQAPVIDQLPAADAPLGESAPATPPAGDAAPAAPTGTEPAPATPATPAPAQ